MFTTAASFQTSVDIHVLQGEREIASCNKTLGRFRLGGIRRAPRGVPQIEVTFSIDANGIVNVAAKDLGTGKRQEITLTQSSNMSSAEIDQAVRDAERYAEEDSLRRQSIELRNRAEELLYQAKAAQKKLSAEDRERIEGLRKRVKKAMEGKDERELKDASEELKRALEAVGRFTDDGATGSEDGAMDADFSAASNDGGDRE